VLIGSLLPKILDSFSVPSSFWNAPPLKMGTAGCTEVLENINEDRRIFQKTPFY
jgi:hypothetical protein